LSPDGKSILNDYGSFFRVINRADFSLTYENSGAVPRFSPTGRFVYFFKSRSSNGSPDATDFIAYDLLAQVKAVEATRNDSVGDSTIASIRWALGDSILSIGMDRKGGFATYSTLTDREPYLVSTGPNMASVFDNRSTVHIDLDRLLLRYSPYWSDTQIDREPPRIDSLAYDPGDIGEVADPHDAEIYHKLLDLEDSDPGKDHNAPDGRSEERVLWALDDKIDFFHDGVLKTSITSKNVINVPALRKFDDGGSALPSTVGVKAQRSTSLGQRNIDQLDARVFAQLPESDQSGFRDDIFGKRLEDLSVVLSRPGGVIRFRPDPKEDEDHKGDWLTSAILKAMPAASPFIGNIAACDPADQSDDDPKKVSPLKIIPYFGVSGSSLTSPHHNILIVAQACSTSPSVDDYLLRVAAITQTDNLTPKLIWLNDVKIGDKTLESAMGWDRASFPAPSIEAEIVDDKYLLVGSGDNGSAFELNLENGDQTLFKGDEDEDFGAVKRLYRTDSGAIVRIDRDLRLHFYSPTSKNSYLGGRFIDDEIVINDDQGFYAGSDEGARFVYLTFPGVAIPAALSQYKTVLKRPDIIFGALKSGDDDAPDINLLPPPEVSIAIDAAAARNKSAEVRISGKASAGLKTITSLLDGKVFNQENVTGAEYNIGLKLPPGGTGRWLTVVASDQAGTLSAPVSLALPKSPASNTGSTVHTIAVGNTKYSDPEIHDLKAPALDALAFLRAVAASPIYTVHDTPEPLIDDPNLEATLLDRLQALASNSKPNDTLMLLISGHGVRGPDGHLYLATLSTRIGDIAHTALRWDKVADALARIPGRKIVFLDVCHAGAAVPSSNDEVSAEMLADDSNLIILSASKGRQLSQENKDGGLFTAAIVKAVTQDRKLVDTDHNGAIELSELYRAIKAKVVGATSAQQTPWIARGSIVGPVPIF
jgi:hypothetical protein